MRERGFEIVSEYKNEGINLPVRKTAASAGYDIEAAADAVLKPGAVTLIPTGLKAYMLPDEYLGIHIRSGLAVKKAVSCVNSQGIIDADYYNNQDNEGHIMVALINHGASELFIEKGTRIAQGIFYKYLTADGDEAGTGGKRSGGFGSTGEK